MSPARFRWGILFILVGGLLLMNNIGWLDWWVWVDILSFWPLILIAIGVEKIFSKTRLEVLSYLAPLALAGAIIWIAWDGITTKQGYFGGGKGYSYDLSDIEDVDRLAVKFDMNDCDLTLRSTSRYAFKVREDGVRWLPKIEYEKENGIAYIDLEARKSWRYLIGRHRWDGDIDTYVSTDLPVSIDCRGDESDMRIDCRRIMLQSLDISSEEGHVKIYLGNRSDSVKVDLEGGDRSDFGLSLPRNCALRIGGETDRIEHEFERLGLDKSGQYFTGSSLDSLAIQVYITIGGDISRFSIDYY